MGAKAVFFRPEGYTGASPIYIYPTLDGGHIFMPFHLWVIAHLKKDYCLSPDDIRELLNIGYTAEHMIQKQSNWEGWIDGYYDEEVPNS